MKQMEYSHVQSRALGAKKPGPVCHGLLYSPCSVQQKGGILQGFVGSEQAWPNPDRTRGRKDTGCSGNKGATAHVVSNVLESSEVVLGAERARGGVDFH
jgi:hypothetical protein